MMLILSMLWGGLSKFIGAAFTFFTTKPGVYIGVALLVIAAFWFTDHRAFNRGIATQQALDTKLRLIAEQDAYVKGLAFQQRTDKNLADIQFTAGEAKGREEAKTVTIIKRIPQYVSVETDRNFPMPCGLLRLHDAAALGIPAETVSLPAGYTDEKPCPVKASVLADIVVENYGLYHVAETQIKGLQDLARSLKFAIENPQ